MQNNEITIIINTFNSEDKIFSCLNSIGSDYKIIIIENSDNNKFKKKIENKYANVQCILTGNNLGYAKGNNLGLSKVKSKYALILNPDATLEKNTINNFFIEANKKPDFAIIGPAIQDEKQVNEKNGYKQDNLLEVKNLKGFAMFLNLKEFVEIGFFDDNFFIYFEEIDLCNRLEQKNKKIYLSPKIIVHHKGGSSHNKSINFEMELSRNWHWMWSTFYYQKKYRGFLNAFLKVFPKLSSAFFKVFLYTVFFNFEKRKIYYQRLSGLINSILGKSSWYRPRIFLKD